MTSPLARSREDGAGLANAVGTTVTFLAADDETGGSLSVFEIVVPPGIGPWLHRHPQHDEFLYALEGTVVFRLADELVDAPAGTFVFVPRGVPHTWQNRSDAPARLLATFTPAAPGMQSFFRESAALGANATPRNVFEGVGSGGEMETLGPPLAESHS